VAISIVRADSGGIAVTESEFGTPYVEADNGYGIAVTFVDSGGFPVAAVSAGIVNALGFDAFNFSGGNFPINAINVPAAFYDPVSNKTWICLQNATSNNAGDAICVVLTYDHATGEYSDPITLGSMPLGADVHQNGGMALDYQGYCHAMYGTHNTQFKYSVSASPNDATAFTDQDANSPTLGTYPKVIPVGQGLYFFCRDDTHEFLTLTKTTALANGVATWGTTTNIIDFGSPNRIDSGNFVLNGNFIEFGATFTDNDDTYRNDVYYFRYNTVDGSVSNIDGSFSTAAGSLPVSLTSAQTHYRIYTSASTSDAINVPQLGIDKAGTRHITFSDGPATGSAFTAYHVAAPAGAGANPKDTIGTNNSRFGVIAVVPAADGGVDLYWPQASAKGFVRGGDLWTAHVSANLTVGASSLFYTAVNHGVEDVMMVDRPHRDATVLFSENLDDETVINGNLKSFLYGPRGYVKRPFDPVTQDNALVGYFPLDAATTDFAGNTTQDLSGNGSTGTLVNMTSANSVAGQISEGISFNGGNQGITWGTPAALRPLALPIAVSFWIKPTAYDPNFGVIFGNDVHATFSGGILIELSDTGLILAQANTGAGSGTTNRVVAFSADPIPLNEWTFVHVAFFAMSTGAIEIDINGESAAIGSTNGTGSTFGYIVGDAGKVAIDNTIGDDVLTGYLDDLRMYTTPLNPGQLQQLYQAGLLNHR